jgi:tRNA (guanine-N7-)-methyltransferase
MAKNKLKRFAECVTFPNFLQPEFEDIVDGFYLKGKWNRDFFENSNPVILELGCGKGEYTVGLARKYQQKNFIGIDRKGARMWVGGKISVEEDLANIGFLRARLEFITHFFGKGEVSEIWITFPDPQLRKKQVRKRMTSPRYLARYKEFLKPDGIIHLKTDNTIFYDYTLEVIEEYGHELILKTGDLYNSGHHSYRGELEAADIQTYYENMHLEEGLKIKYLQFRLGQTNL